MNLAQLRPESPSEVTAARFLANVFLCPRYLKRIIHYWLWNYVPLMTATGAMRPSKLEVPDLQAALLVRLLRLPSDMVLVSQGNLALTVDATQAHYVHFLSFMDPAAADMSLAVPVAIFAHKAFEDFRTSLFAMFCECDSVWRQCDRGGMQGQERCQGLVRPDWLARFYRPVMTVGLCLWLFVEHQCQGKPVEWQANEGVAIVDAVFLALEQHKTIASNLTPSDQERVLRLLRISAQSIRQHRSLRQLLDTIYDFIKNDVAVATCDYAQLMAECDVGFPPEEYVRFPWHSRGWTDGMDVDG
jgi:hypothetical protein